MNIGPSDQKNDNNHKRNMRKNCGISQRVLWMLPKGGGLNHRWPALPAVSCHNPTRCHNNLSNLTLKGEGVRQQPNMKHFLELNRLILFTANFCLKVDLISGETGFLQEQFHSVYATDTLTCSSVKRMWLYYESKVYVPINSWMFKDSITTHWCSWISWIHFPHVLSQQNKTPWGAPGEAMVIATCPWLPK